ncbi:hypothetical protein [Rhizobium sp. B21/90]|uniref:hypothetical protein n=1 Tax=Rhizobium sp. B21/90 TaxID=2819993 RepID=UPI001C5AEACE|nr:hypothetical protein [Rhizobium sp. B21/90]QYA04529.1 hypothetical protein J5278_20420 [Rhizobium sp. B21/90]
MTEYYTLKFYRVAFGDTKFTDIPLFGSPLPKLKEEACAALYARFSDMKTDGKGSQAPHTAALLDENEHVVARFEVRPVVQGRGGEEAVELASQLWLDRWPGTPSPAILQTFE